jgi:hypothetical protein
MSRESELSEAVSALSRHSKACQTHALVCAIENMRDATTLGMVSLASAVAAGVPVLWASTYYRDGNLSPFPRCETCEVSRLVALGVGERTARKLAPANIKRAYGTRS